MRTKKLSARCEAMAGFVGAGERIADIGADHASLPLYLVREGISPFAVLTDVKPGPLQRTRESVQKALEHSGEETEGDETKGDVPSVLQSKTEGTSPFVSSPSVSSPLCSGFDLRLGDGLDVLAEREVDTVLIAGMGGETIISILKADPAKSGSFSKYILQPRTKTEKLKVWLLSSGWKIFAETIAEEKGRFCDIIVCAPKEGKL